MHALLARARDLWERRPLAILLAAAAAARLVAVLFSRGYGMHDDHFFVVEVAQRWVEGYRDWLGDPSSTHPLLYPGLHYALFAGLEKVGLTDPQSKMLVVRLLHAAYSLLTVVYGYELARALAGEKPARLAGVLLALFWIVPFLAVRNLVEVVCQPPLVAGFALLAKGGPAEKPRRALWAGLLFGLAFAIRLQTAVLPAAAGLVLLAGRRWRTALALGLGFLVSAALIQGSTDFIGYGRPFSSLLAYVRYNSDRANIYGYVVGPWYRYLELLAGALIPPTSLLLLLGIVWSWRRCALVFWPTLGFLVLHSIYPNKQERFLLPVLPFLLVLAAVGWRELVAASASERLGRLCRGLWRWFWAVNALLLVVFSTTYSKKTRVETLSWLRGRPDLTGIVLESDEPSVIMPPLYYLGRPVPVFELPAGKGVQVLREDIARRGGISPNYLVFMGQRDLPARLARVAPLFPRLALEERIAPSLVDGVAHRLNPRHNVNQTCAIYRILAP